MARTRAANFSEKQRAILESAAAVFAEMGMDKASMSLVASRASVSKALVYHYYPSKDALIFGIIHTHLSELDSAVEAAADPDLDAPARLRKMVWSVLETYRGADNQHKVQLNGMTALTNEQRREIRAIERRIVDRFSAVLRSINPGLDKPARPLLMPVTMSLFGMLNWVYLWFREDGPITRQDYANVATALLLEGISAVR